MKNSFPTISLQAKLTGCILLTGFALVAFSALLLYEALEYNGRAGRIVQISHCTEQFFLAIKEITFERGRTNIVLVAEAPITKVDIEFIELRRKSSDEHIAMGLAMLEKIDLAAADNVRSRYATFLNLRKKVDYALNMTTVAEKEKMRKDWFEQSTVFIYQLKDILEVLGKKEFDWGRLARYHQFQLDVIEFRILSGHSASIFSAAINKKSPWLSDEYFEFMERRAQADYLWSRIESNVVDFKNDKLTQEMSQVYNAYYGIYRQAQNALLPLILAKEVPLQSVEQLKDLSIPAFDSVFTLVDTANSETLAYVETIKNKAAVALEIALLQFFIGLVFVSFTIVYFKNKLFEPLNHIIKALKNISAGEKVSPLEEEEKRHDEIGKLTQGVRMLQESRDEERRLKELNEYLAMTDTLTGCLNRRAFYQRAEIEIARVARENKTLAFAIFDVDNMKYINDTYGHVMGDEMLKHLIKNISDSCRPYDLIGRFGGDEFMLCIQGISKEKIKDTIERIHSAIQKKPLIIDDFAEPLCVSIGVIFVDNEDEKPLSWFIGQADIALYQAKLGGKNGIVFV